MSLAVFAKESITVTIAHLTNQDNKNTDINMQIIKKKTQFKSE